MPEDTKDLAEMHSEALKQYHVAENREKDQREKAVDDMAFCDAEEGQWEESVISKRRDRPRYTFNKVAGARDQLVGDQRQNETAIKVSPDTGADDDVAEVYTGLVRSIEQQSKAKNAYDNGYDEQVTGGYGGWRVLTDFNDDDIFEQDICIEPIKSAASSLFFDPAAIQYDKRDANWAFLITSITKEEFNKRFPDSSENDWESERYRNSDCNGWFSEDVVRVAEYWYKRPIRKTLALLSDGRVIDKDEEGAVLDELAAQGITVIRERTTDSHVVEMILMSGTDVLEGPKDWAGKYIPLIPVYGRVSNVEGKTYVRGIVRNAKDPQRVYNYAASAAIEAAAMAPKDPIWITATQAEGFEEDLRRFNTQNSPFMRYNPDPQAPGAPARTGAPSVQTALLGQMQQAMLDIHAGTGMEPASMGNSPELKSGKAIQAQQAMGDRGAFIFQDNLSKSIAYTGEILVDLIPRIYDTERIVRVTKMDGTSKEVIINQEVKDMQTGEVFLVNDLVQGKYTVSVSSGPAFRTQKEQSVDKLLQFLQMAPPEVMAASLDIIADQLDILDNDELKKRLRSMMITAGTVQPTPEEVEELGIDQNPPPNPMDQALVTNVEMQTEETAAKIVNIEADTAKKIADANKTQIDGLTDLMKAIAEKVGAGIPVTPQDADLLEGQKAAVEESQLTSIEEAAEARDVKQAQAQMELDAQQQQAPGVVDPAAGIVPVQDPTGPTGPQGGPELPIEGV